MTEIEKKANKKSLSYDTKYSEDRTLKDMLSRPQAFVEGVIEGIVNLLRQKVYRDGYIAGAKENGNVWHDLRKNPADLPEERHDVLCFVIHNEHRYYLQGYYNGGTFRCTPLGTYLNDEDVKAWCEIHTFKE